MKKNACVSKVYSLTNRVLGQRNFRVWTPPEYEKENDYPLVFVFDGEMMFSDEHTWNGLTWKLDKVAERLILQGDLSPCIIVAVYSGGQGRRFQELLPENVFNHFPEEQKKALGEAYHNGAFMIPGAVCSHAFTAFIVEELWPFVRRKYTAEYSKEAVYIMGASMGGLAALNAVCEYPNVFSGAACLSTHWPGVLPNANMNQIQKPPVSDQLVAFFSSKIRRTQDQIKGQENLQKLYFDYGDQELDAEYPELQKRMDQALRDMNYPEALWVSKYFPGDGHSERAWGARVHEALQFLLND